MYVSVGLRVAWCVWIVFSAVYTGSENLNEIYHTRVVFSLAPTYIAVADYPTGNCQPNTVGVPM